MKTTKSVLMVVFFTSIFFYCNKPSRQDCPESQVTISGVVTDVKGVPLENVTLASQGKVVQSDKTGGFKLECLTPGDRIVLNVSKFGYGFVSKIYRGNAEGVKISLAKANTQTIDLGNLESDSIVIVDMNPDISSPLSSSYSSSNPLADLPFVFNERGELVGFEMPSSLQATYSGLSLFTPPVLGATVIIPKNGLEINDDNDEVDVSIQTIDLYSPDGMPGDYSVQMQDGRTGFMRSFGAVNFEILQNGKDVRLKPKFEAKIIIPVDTLSILTKQKLPDTIPFLVYDQTTGRWKTEGIAKLDKGKMCYVATTSHFSSFNMDMVFGDESTCYKICNTITSIPFGDLRAEISVSDPSKTKQNLMFDIGCSTPGNCSTGSAHGIVNLSPFEPVGLRIFNTNPSTTLVSSYVFVAGDKKTGAKDCTNSFDLCDGPVAITNVLNQKYFKTGGDGMCRPLLAVPVKSSVSNSSPLTFKLAWLYDNDFAVTTDQASFEVEVSMTDSDGGFSSISTIPLTANRLHNFVYSTTFAEGTYYFRVVEGASNNSNWVCITVDSMGTSSMCTSVNQPTPTDCM
jgi:hypothetical protein